MQGAPLAKIQSKPQGGVWGADFPEFSSNMT